MTPDFVKTLLRENGYLALLLVAAIGAALWGYTRSNGAEADGKEALPAARGAVTAEAGASEADGAAGLGRPSPESLIAEHRRYIERNPEADDAPARLGAMGNLYRQKLGDYRNAAQCYELLLHDYPDAAAARNAYIQLLTCYERLGDRENLRRICETLLKLYPPEAQEHQYALQVLAR